MTDLLIPVTIGFILGWLMHWMVVQPWGETPVPQRPGVHHPDSGAQPDRPSDQPAEPPDVGTVVQGRPEGPSPTRNPEDVPKDQGHEGQCPPGYDPRTWHFQSDVDYEYLTPPQFDDSVMCRRLTMGEQLQLLKDTND